MLQDGKVFASPTGDPTGYSRTMPFPISSLGFCILMRKSSPVGGLLINAKPSVMARKSCLRDGHHFIGDLPAALGEDAEQAMHLGSGLDLF